MSRYIFTGSNGYRVGPVIHARTSAEARTRFEELTGSSPAHCNHLSDATGYDDDEEIVMGRAVSTLKDLIHELSAEWTMADQPVHVSGWDSAGNHVVYVVTGISVRTGRDGKPVQSLKLRSTEER
jgi:hypothetical protein